MPLPTTREEFANYKIRMDDMPVAEEAEDAWLDLASIAATDPDEAWPIIVELLRTKDEDELRTIGAGVLETFISYHGTTWAAPIEDEMFGNPRLITAMAMVRGIDKHPELARRISHFFGE